jgi:hypothetical protein
MKAALRSLDLIRLSVIGTSTIACLLPAGCLDAVLDPTTRRFLPYPEPKPLARREDCSHAPK